MSVENDLISEWRQLLSIYPDGVSNTSTTKYNKLIQCVSNHLKIPANDIYATGAGNARSSNLDTRLVQGDQAGRHTPLGIGIIQVDSTASDEEVERKSDSAVVTAKKFVDGTDSKSRYDVIIIMIVRGDVLYPQRIIASNKSLGDKIKSIYTNAKTIDVIYSSERFMSNLTQPGNGDLFTSNTEQLDQIILNFASACKNANIQFNSQNNDILSLVCSELSKSFLILSGLSGSGKTKLSQAFSQWLTPKKNPENDILNYVIIPIGADWTSNENILGYPDGINPKKYSITPALEIILRASKDSQNRPYFLILDEMNLSHVERYFADILSAIESTEEIPLYEGTLRHAFPETDSEAAKILIPHKLKLPKNLFIIGTVNVDETTYQFSPKVLDRANVIEFRMTESDMSRCLSNPVEPKLDAIAGQGVEFGAAFVQAASLPVVLEDPIKSAFAAEMQRFFVTLKTHNSEFGYRTAHEAARFVHFYRVLGNHPADDLKAADKEFDAASGEFKPVTSGQTWFDSAMDTVVIQKLLPKLHGSRSKLENLLIDLSLVCAWDAKTQAEMLASPEGDKKSTKTPASVLAVLHKSSGKARYPRSFEKLKRMLEKLRRDQFVSFSEA